ncbi:unnamed protein product, partial [Polarella glacialis]
IVGGSEPDVRMPETISTPPLPEVTPPPPSAPEAAPRQPDGYELPEALPQGASAAAGGYHPHRAPGSSARRSGPYAVDVQLVGKARHKELVFGDLEAADQERMCAAMGREWAKWLEHKSVRWLSAEDFRKLRGDHGELRVVGTRWVLTQKPDGSFKARLVVQGCQEQDLGLRV